MGRAEVQQAQAGAPVSRFGRFIGPTFLLAAAWFTFGPDVAQLPRTTPAVISTAALTNTPRRSTVGDPPKIMLNSFERRCTDCHGIFDAAPRAAGPRQQHAHIVLDHGINDTCGNCHNMANLDQLVLYNGAPVSYAEAPQLCRKCHGPTYQDWQRGIHGRVNDFWNSKSGVPRRLLCIQCHDPHAPRHPAMDPLVPLPGPNTLRMCTPGQAADEATEATEVDPLRRALHAGPSSDGKTATPQEEPNP